MFIATIVCWGALQCRIIEPSWNAFVWDSGRWVEQPITGTLATTEEQP